MDVALKPDASGRVSASTRTCCAHRTTEHTIRGKLTRTGGTYDICVTKVDTIEHRGSFAQQDLNNKESDKQGTYSLPGHEAMERAIIRYATLAEVKANPNFAHENEGDVKGALINKVGYSPSGEKPGHDEKLLPRCMALRP